MFHFLHSELCSNEQIEDRSPQQRFYEVLSCVLPGVNEDLEQLMEILKVSGGLCVTINVLIRRSIRLGFILSGLLCALGCTFHVSSGHAGNVGTGMNNNRDIAI